MPNEAFNFLKYIISLSNYLIYLSVIAWQFLSVTLVFEGEIKQFAPSMLNTRSYCPGNVEIVNKIRYSICIVK